MPEPQKTMPKGTEIFTLDQIQLGESTTTLVYGDSKSGKTYFIGTCGSRMVYIYFTVGEGISTLQSPQFKKEFPNFNPIVIPIRETNTVKAFDAVKQAIDYVVDNRRDEFDFIAVDEMTAFKKAAMWKGLEISQIEDRSKTLEKVESRKDLKALPGYFMPAIQDYGAEMGLLEWWTATYTDDAKENGYHLVVGAHVRYTYEKLNNKPNTPEVLSSIKPGFTGKTFPDDITRYYDNVFYLEHTGKGATAQHRLTIKGDELITAGTRYGGVFVDKNGREVSYIDNANYSEMLKMITASKEEIKQ